MKDFKEMMIDYNKGVNTFSYLKEAAVKDPGNIEVSLKLADKYSMYGENDKAKELLKRIIELDALNSKGKTDDAKFRLASYSEKEQKIKDLESFIKDNPESDQLKDAYVSVSENYFYELNDQASSEKWFKETLAKFPGDESVGSSYGQYLNQKAVGLADKGSGEEDYKKGLTIIDEALTYLVGSVNEASSYYIQSKLYYNLKEYSKAMESVDKSLKIFDRKLYRDHKDKIQKQLSSK
jgi:tetratricopeptide (TPR) repeat protein